MTRKIKCAGCNDYMGEIRDATLKKGMVVLCSDCEKSRENAFNMLALSETDRRSYKGYSALKSIFGLDA